MPHEPSDADRDLKPRIQINKAGWRFATLASLLATVGIACALVAQTSLGPGPDGSEADPLATLALVFAVIAFFAQIVVYTFQTNAANASTRRNEELNNKTQSLLDEIKATSDATQRVLFSQFDRLLDYVVKGQASAALGEAGVPDEEGDADSERNGPQTSELDAIVSAAVERGLAAARPVFSTPSPSRMPSAEDLRVLRYLRSWPTNAEAADLIGTLAKLSTLGAMKFKRYVDKEVEQRSAGRAVGLLPPADGSVARSTQELLDLELVRREDDRFVLTELGRNAGRLAASVKDDPPTDWSDDNFGPLLAR